MKPLVILFDIDGTLIRSQGAGKTAIKLALTQALQVEEPDVELDFAGRTDISIVKETFLRNQIKFTDPNVKKFFKSYLSYLEQTMNECQGRVLPGVTSFLDSLVRQNRAVLGLLTGNIREGAFIKLRHFGLDQYFQTGGFGDLEEERVSIAREGIQAVASHHRIDIGVDKVVIIGDTPFDVRCAKMLGARSIAVCTGYSERRDIEETHPDWIFNDLTDLFTLHRVLQEVAGDRQV